MTLDDLGPRESKRTNGQIIFVETQKGASQIAVGGVRLLLHQTFIYVHPSFRLFLRTPTFLRFASLPRDAAASAQDDKRTNVAQVSDQPQADKPSRVFLWRLFLANVSVFPV